MLPELPECDDDIEGLMKELECLEVVVACCGTP
jgi:hypothetical protein